VNASSYSGQPSSRGSITLSENLKIFFRFLAFHDRFSEVRILNPGVVPPGEDLLDERVIKTSFFFQHLQNRSTEKLGQGWIATFGIT